MKVPQWLYASTDEMQRVLALLIQQMQTNLSDNGFIPPTINNSMKNAITASTFEPVMPPGTFWFNPDEAPNGKLQLITVQAIPAGLPGGPANAIVETVTSA